ncbi:hypothetical protein N5C46_09440 [Rossellomorea vietnamensis]|uniref:Uncharacterized protein n=1 Tax=Rossellomorea vietnamensis TaxID=218284 RepID=A0ACD4CC58_9BACI|nr:hypothetical protein [Rossellomorea vietnamensis]UXH46245.1 hypothetical protein N5C46_09440 [Rossellomorea vietnamensis]
MFNFYKDEMILKQKIRDMQERVAMHHAKSASSINTKKIEDQLCCGPCCPAV